MAATLTLTRAPALDTAPVASVAPSRPAWAPAEVSFAELSAADVANSGGLLILRDVAPAGAAAAALRSIASLMDDVAARPELGVRANQAYTKNMVYKDSHHQGRGGPTVDAKRVIDLSPQRLSAIAAVDAPLSAELPHLQPALDFFNDLRARVAPRALAALAQATGINLCKDSLVNYRMVDYYSRPVGEVAPRCGEHRDFGTLSIIFEDRPALQALVDGQWRDLSIPADSCLLLFGWVTQVRANDRLPAVLHRVRDPVPVGGVVPRRISAVLFVGPEPDTDLTPVLQHEGELPNYRSVQSEEMRSVVGRKWRHREGTLVDPAALQQEAQVAHYADQDAVVNAFFRLHRDN